MIEIVFGLVKDHEYKNIYENDEHLCTEVKTPHCGWQLIAGHPTCTKGCDINCKLCQVFLDEIGVEY